MNNNDLITISSDEETTSANNEDVKSDAQLQKSLNACQQVEKKECDEVIILSAESINETEPDSKDSFLPKIVDVKSCADVFSINIPNEAKALYETLTGTTKSDTGNCKCLHVDSFIRNQVKEVWALKIKPGILKTKGNCISKNLGNITLNANHQSVAPNEPLEVIQSESVDKYLSEETEKQALPLVESLPLSGESAAPQDKGVSDDANHRDVENIGATDCEKTTENSVNSHCSELFEKFLTEILSREDNENDKVRLKKKLMKKYDLADPEFVKSTKFKEILENGLKMVCKNPTSMYFIVKDLLDYLSQNKVGREPNKEPNGGPSALADSALKEKGSDEASIEDQKRERKIMKLSKTLKLLEKKIKELEEAEVDLSDEEDSSYFKMQRYRQRFCQLYKKFCEYTGETADAKRVYTRRIHFSGTKYPALNEALEKWLNKSKQFPDFADVMKFVEEQKAILPLILTKERIRNLATEVFAEVGNTLQRRRKYDLWDSFGSYLDNTEDPAVHDADLQAVLVKNFEIGAKKEQEIINYFAEKQINDRLEPFEIPDEEAGRSPVESSDEDEKELEKVENELKIKFDSKITSEEMTENELEMDEDSGEQQGTPTEKVDEGMENVAPSAANEKSSENQSGGDGAETSKQFAESNETEADNIKDPPSTLTPDAKVKRYRNGLNCGSESSPQTEKPEFVKASKRPKLEKRFDGSDYEIVDLTSDDEDLKSGSETNYVSPHRFHQVNYAFVNKTFNLNSILFDDDLFYKKKSRYCLNYKTDKSRKNRMEALSNLKTSWMKHIRGKEFDEKRKLYGKKSRFCQRRFERLTFKSLSSVVSGDANRQCSPQKENNETDPPCQDGGSDEDRTPEGNSGTGGESGEDGGGDDGNKENRNFSAEEADDEQEEEEEDEEEDSTKADADVIYLGSREAKVEDNLRPASNGMLRLPAKRKVHERSDEDIVNNFLQNSPASISITTPKKSSAAKPSGAVREALERLSRMKGISIVKGSSSSGQNYPTPKIVSVRGNFPGFDNLSSSGRPNRKRTNTSGDIDCVILD